MKFDIRQLWIPLLIVTLLTIRRVRANGWVMLNQVPLGYEIWRQLNGFPPSVSKKEPGASEAKTEKKKVKLPK